MGTYFTLIGQTPVPEPDLLTWGKWMETADRVVSQTTISGKLVSTVFLGLDHNFGDGEPLLFETMIFSEDGDGMEEYCERYTTWLEAELGHKRAIEIAAGKGEQHA